MAKAINEQELAVTERFDRFVAEHIGQAAFWFVIQRGENHPESFIQRVEFDTDLHHRPNVGRDDEPFLFLMDVLTLPSLDPEQDSITVEHNVDRRIRVSDPQKELTTILDVTGAHRRRNWVRSASLLMDHLAELEDAGHFVPGYLRHIELTD